MRNLENRAWNFRTTEGPKRRLPQLDYMIMLAQFIFLFPFSDDLLGDVMETAGQFSIFPAKKHQVWQLSINQSMCVGVRGPVEKFQHTARAKTTWDLILWRGKRNSFTAAMVTLPQSSTAQCPEDTLSPWFFQRGKVRAFECLTPPAVQEAAKGPTSFSPHAQHWGELRDWGQGKAESLSNYEELRENTQTWAFQGTTPGKANWRLSASGLALQDQEKVYSLKNAPSPWGQEVWSRCIHWKGLKIHWKT